MIKTHEVFITIKQHTHTHTHTIPDDILSHIMISVLSSQERSWIRLDFLLPLCHMMQERETENVNYGGSQPVRHTGITEAEGTGRQTDKQTGRETGKQADRQTGGRGNNWPLIFTLVTRVTFPSELEAWQVYRPADCMLTARRDNAPSWEIRCDSYSDSNCDTDACK